MGHGNDASVILVDSRDNIIGYESKITAYEQGLLTRAFALHIFNDKGEILLQLRSKDKYCESGLWDIGCGGYSVPGENTETSAINRAKFELGIEVSVDKVACGCCKQITKSGRPEQWYFHFFRTSYVGEIYPDPNEVIEYKWVTTDYLFNDIKQNPTLYTTWAKYFLKHYRRILFDLNY